MLGHKNCPTYLVSDVSVYIYISIIKEKTCILLLLIVKRKILYYYPSNLDIVNSYWI